MGSFSRFPKSGELWSIAPEPILGGSFIWRSSALGRINIASWLRLLKKSAVRWRENSPDLILQGRDDTRGHFNGSTSRQGRVLGVSTSPFVSMMRNTAQWARYFVPCAFRRLFQQPRLATDIHGWSADVRVAPDNGHRCQHSPCTMITQPLFINPTRPDRFLPPTRLTSIGPKQCVGEEHGKVDGFHPRHRIVPK